MSMNNLFDQFIGAEPRHGAGKNITGISGVLGKIRSYLPEGMLGGAAAGSIVALLMSNKSARKFAGTAASYGGSAVLGGLAFKAFKNWQLNNYDQSAGARWSATRNSDSTIGYENYHYGSHVAAPDYELKLIKAMIAAAKADGHIDAEEQQKIFQSVARINLTSEMKAMVFDMLNHPIAMEEIVAGVHDIGQRSELFLAACLVVDPDIPSVKVHLDLMANALVLPEELKQQIIRQAQEVINEPA